MSINALLLLSAVVASVPHAAQSQVANNEVVLQGALSPSEVRADIEAVCFGNTFKVGISYDRLGNANLSHVLINGQSHLASPSAIAAAQIVQSLNRPYISSLKCRDKETISVSVSGIGNNMTSRNEEIRSFELSARK